MPTTPGVSQTRMFVDYYRTNDISPVAQNIADLDRHFERRSSLYRSLGIPPLYPRERSVLEFGPGSGHNSLYTQALEPRRYVLVDANPRGLRDTQALFAQRFPQATNYEIVASLIEDYATSERFALVLAEGLVAFQREPAALSRHIASFAEPGGIVVLTCSDAASALGEIARRLIAAAFFDPAQPIGDRIGPLTDLFAPHLATLRGMSRSAHDWVADNILQPFVGRTFGIDEAIDALDAGFDFYGSSPEFVVDLRWYKQLVGDDRRFNANAIDACLQHMLNFVDYRVTLAPHDVALGVRIRDCCRELYREMQAVEASGGRIPARTTVPRIRELASVCEPSPRTAAALHELAASLACTSLDEARACWHEFPSFFGRGMQYVSFIRRATTSSSIRG